MKNFSMKPKLKMLEAFSHQGIMPSEAEKTWSYDDRHQILIAQNGLVLMDDHHSSSILCGPNIAFIPKKVYHSAQVIGQPVFFQTVFFSNESIQDLIQISSHQLPSSTTVFPSSPLLRELLDKLCEKSRSSLEVEPYRTTLKLLYYTFLEQKNLPPIISLPKAYSQRLKSILEYFDEYYEYPLSLPQLEERFSLSRRTIERLFKKELNLTVSEYLRMKRIFVASILLLTTSKQVLEIALEVGYDSLSSFYKAFTKITGVTPKQYRQDLAIEDLGA